MKRLVSKTSHGCSHMANHHRAQWHVKAQRSQSATLHSNLSAGTSGLELDHVTAESAWHVTAPPTPQSSRAPHNLLPPAVSYTRHEIRPYHLHAISLSRRPHQPPQRDQVLSCAPVPTSRHKHTWRTYSSAHPSRVSSIPAMIRPRLLSLRCPGTS